jgi:hypothetical protein
MALIRLRLNDYYNLPFRQEEVDFAIPFLDEDIPLYVDPFLLWKINSQQDNALHTYLVNSFNQLGHLFLKGKESETKAILVALTECNEVGLGNSKTRQGKRVGEKTAGEILNLFKTIPQVTKQGFQHFEEIQLFIDSISKNRIIDITCSLVKSFLVAYKVEISNKFFSEIEYFNVETTFAILYS